LKTRVPPVLRWTIAEMKPGEPRGDLIDDVDGDPHDLGLIRRSQRKVLMKVACSAPLTISSIARQSPPSPGHVQRGTSRSGCSSSSVSA
jgi:hypothetical protein